MRIDIGPVLAANNHLSEDSELIAGNLPLNDWLQNFLALTWNAWNGN